jgi:CubicO group peptidase (beta-lactamase class C family)
MFRALALLLAATTTANAAIAQTPPLGAAESTPGAFGLMQGFPATAGKQVRFDNASMWSFPNTRWSFSHWRELVPTVGIRRGTGPISDLARKDRIDIDTLRFKTLRGQEISWADSLGLNYTDGIVVLHKGRIVYERYFGALAPGGQHIAFSVTKSFVGTLAELLIAEGKLDPARPMASYVPELAGSGFGDATVRQVMEMRTAIAFDEDYTARGTALTDVTRMGIAGGSVPAPPGFSGPDGLHDFVATIGGAGGHGGDFAYRTPNTQALAWVIERITGEPIARLIEDRFWLRMGMEEDAALGVDRRGTAFAGGGMTASLRDMARFGEMIRQNGRWHGQQILPKPVAAAILKPGDVAAFASARYPGLDGGSYASQWWHRAGGQVMAVGVHGQGIYIDPAAEMVIARFASHPTATNRAINPVTIPAYDALGAFLNTKPAK